jgi:hypothetical protein
MKNSVTFSAIPSFAALLLVACDSSTPEITFEAAFPKQHQDLTAVLGEEFQIRQGQDTLRYRLATNRQAAVITTAGEGDTLFFGKITHFRGVYYFNQPKKDGTYYLHAVKIRNNLIHGLHSREQQGNMLVEQIRKGAHKNLVTYISPDSSQIRLKANKKELKELFATVLPQITPDTLVTSHTAGPRARLQTSKPSQPPPQKSPFLVSAFPNPTKDIVNLRLRETHLVNYQLTDLKGKTVAQGQEQGELLHIDLHHLQSGIYALTLTLTDHQRQEQESLRIVKQ